MAKGLYKEWLTSERLIQIQGWKRNGLTEEQIAHNIGINVRTLGKWKSRFGQLRQALKIGREQANFIVEGELFKKAVKGNTTAMIFFLKNNWRDKYNDSQLSPEEREQAKARTRKLLADARISEAKAAIAERLNSEDNDQLDVILDKLVKEAGKDGASRSNDGKAD